MAYKVLIVDDSSFFQSRLKEIINAHPDLTVAGVASNGREAIEMARSLHPDVISMDYEMPFLDGISAVRAIMAERPVPIVMFSSLTYEGARITLEALDAGAVDFMPKNFAEISRRSEEVAQKLQERLLLYAREAHVRRRPVAATPAPAREPVPEVRRPAPGARGNLKDRVQLLIIGASTGGPVAVTDVLVKLPAGFPIPIVVVQHMPANFTKVFAERLDRQCSLRVREAENGDRLQPGLVLVAPGAQQLMFDRNGWSGVKVKPGDERMNYRPSVDIAFGSAANAYGDQVLGVVLTGMGADGCEGARLLKEKGSVIWGQDQASCVVYGMPKAVATAGLTDLVLPLMEIGPRLAKEF